MPFDLTQLPAPQLIEALDFETLFGVRKQRLLAAAPAELRDALAATLELESEPLTLLLQENAYTELVLRQRINDAAKARMLAFARGADLDHKAAEYGVQRLLIVPADPNAEPPVEAVWESDERLQLRCQLAPEGLSVAGSRGAYLFHTLSASPFVVDALVDSGNAGPKRPDGPAPGEVHVYVLDTRGDGVPAPDLLATVQASLSAETVRPLNDRVLVCAGQPERFVIRAQIEFEDGGEALSGGLDAARKRLDAVLASAKRLGTGQKPSGLPPSALVTALKVPGVHDVILLAPTAPIARAVGAFPLCTDIQMEKA
jgi:phage-related baseplate assembly protein